MDPVGITNLALMKIGAQATVSNINPSDGSTEGDAAAILYQPTMDALFRAAHWNFTRRQVVGTLVAAAAGTPENPTGSTAVPLQPWLYSYAYPSDCLKVRYVLPTFPIASVSPPFTTGGPALPFQTTVIGAVPYAVGIDLDQGSNQIKVILSNMENASFVYTARITNCDLWDVHFVEAASATLGAWFVNALSRNAQLSGEMQKLAMGIIQAARVSDGNEGITSADHRPDWISIRSGWSGGGGRGQFWGGWDSISFPGGAF